MKLGVKLTVKNLISLNFKLIYIIINRFEMEFSKHGTGTTSVKVHHGPGGASSFSLGGNYGDDEVKAKPAVAQPQQ